MASAASQTFAFHHVGIMVPDMDAGIAWYADMFGCTVLDRWSNPEAQMEWAHLSLGDLVIELVRIPDLQPAAGRIYALHHIALTVSDCDATVSALAAKGVEVTRQPSDFERHKVRWAFVKDYLGNVIEIMSPLATKTSVAP